MGSERVQIRRPRRQPDHLDTLANENASECLRVLGISIEKEISLVAEEPIARVSDVACDLRHPRIVRMRGNTRDADGSRRDIDKEEDVVRDQALEREDLNAQEVRRREALPSALSETLTIGCAHRAPETGRSRFLSECWRSCRVQPDVLDLPVRLGFACIPTTDFQVPSAQRDRRSSSSRVVDLD